jgi:hypothetical protein
MAALSRIRAEREYMQRSAIVNSALSANVAQ